MTAANFITGARLVPFAGFVYAAHQHSVVAAAIFFLLAWAPDAIDGWLARRLQQTTAFGYVFDKAVDRLVIVGGLLVLLLTKLVPWYALLLITKDILVAPPAWKRRVAGQELRDVGTWGKAATLLQGIALLWLLFGLPFGLTVAAGVALFGVVAGIRYSSSL